MATRIDIAGDLEKVAMSNVGIGALGGAGLGLLAQALRPKDKDQKAWEEYLMSALLGAGLGASAGYGYDQVFSGGDAGPAKQPEPEGEYDPKEYKWWVDPTDKGNAEFVKFVGEQYAKDPSQFLTDPRTVPTGPVTETVNGRTRAKPGQVFIVTPEFAKQYTNGAGVSDTYAIRLSDAGRYGMMGVTDNRGVVYPVVGVPLADGKFVFAPHMGPGLGDSKAIYIPPALRK